MICYDYRCDKCEHVWEVYQEGWEKKFDPKVCPRCGAKTLTRMFGAPSVRMWYSPMHPRHNRGQIKDRSKYAPKKKGNK